MLQGWLVVDKYKEGPNPGGGGQGRLPSLPSAPYAAAHPPTLLAPAAPYAPTCLPSLAAGEERTRRELIPFVNESVDDEDEILLALAEELGEFVPLVGGAQHAHFLLAPLEALATVDETVVRERAVASIVAVTSQMPAASVQEHLLPLLQVRAVWQAAVMAGRRAVGVGMLPALAKPALRVKPGLP